MISNRNEDLIGANILCPYCVIIPQSHHAFRHSVASMMSVSRRLRIGLMSFLVLLNTLSHSVDMTGIKRVSKAIW
jgi:hypothetical protein